MNQKPRVGVIGARKNISGIGEFFVKFFNECGAEVVCIMGNTEESAAETSKHLYEKYNVKVKHYADIREMLRNERLDIVAICSPSRTHYQYLVECLNTGVSVLCEKPFVWGDRLETLVKETESIIGLAKKNVLQLGMNCQWVFTLEYYQSLCGKVIPENVTEFYMYLNPSVKGDEMIPESLPHAIGMLSYVLGAGRVDNMSFTLSEKKDCMNLSFNYLSKFGCCPAQIELKYMDAQPRIFRYGFNGHIVDRVIDLAVDYKISFRYSENKIQIEDPLKSSILDFLTSHINRTSPKINSQQILINMEQLTNVYHAFSVQKE